MSRLACFLPSVQFWVKTGRIRSYLLKHILLATFKYNAICVFSLIKDNDTALC